MGCSISTVVEIRKDGKWQYIKELPEEFNQRNYNLFGFLADVRNDFDADGFKAKGLPEDISSLKFNFESMTPTIISRFENDCKRMCKTSDGRIIETHDSEIKRELTLEEYNELKKDCDAERYSTLCQSWNGEKYKYSVQDCQMVNGQFVDVPLKELYDGIEEYKKEYEEYWCADVGDYGEWDIDFSSEDLHSHSYLSLKELKEKDKTDYLSVKYKMSKNFYNKFLELGGVFPEGFTFKERTGCGSIADAFSEALCPTIMCLWVDEEVLKKNPLILGMTKLEEIAKQYDVSDDDIRIVFAFD